MGQVRCLGQHRCAGHERDPVAHGLGHQLGLVQRQVQGQPQVPALGRVGRDRRDALQVLLGRLDQDVAALAVEGARPLDVPGVLAGGQEARDRELGQRGAVHVVGALLAQDALAHRPTGGDPADPQPAADRLRQRVDVDHVAPGLAAQRARVLALEAQVAVDPVLDDEEAVAPCQLQQARAARRREVEPGRVVAARLDREKADLLAGRAAPRARRRRGPRSPSAPGSRACRSTSPTPARP